jgi:hypothetical protein
LQVVATALGGAHPDLYVPAAAPAAVRPSGATPIAVTVMVAPDRFVSGGAARQAVRTPFWPLWAVAWSHPVLSMWSTARIAGYLAGHTAVDASTGLRRLAGTLLARRRPDEKAKAERLAAVVTGRGPAVTGEALHA